MKKQLFLLPALCFLLAACDNMTTPGTNSTTGTNRADDTGRNVRDRGNQTLTPGDQAENEADRTITQKIRQALMDDDTLSTNAKNIKIITINGVVTLRGPVNNEREKNDIARKIRLISGIKSVDNQIEVIGNERDNGYNANGLRNDRDLNR